MKIISKNVQVYKNSTSWIIPVTIIPYTTNSIKNPPFILSLWHTVAKLSKIPKNACHCDQYEQLANNLPSTPRKLTVL